MFSPRGTGKVAEKSMSFHGRGSTAVEKMRRPKTMPELSMPVRMKGVTLSPKLTKVLLNVTVQGGVGAVQVLISPELQVKDLISAAIKQYVKEGRRPVICASSVDDFDLHYSQFSLESLDREEKIASLGSRNFFLCKRKVVVDGDDTGGIMVASCSKEAEKGDSPPPWLKFISFLL